MDELWIVRHALSKGNVGQPTSSPETTTLDSIEGRPQANRLADALLCEFKTKGATPDYFAATTYFRTQQTIYPTLTKLGLDSYEVLRAFREITYLTPEKYNGTTQEQRQEAARLYWENADPKYVDGPGADSFNQVVSNLKQGLARLRAYPQKFGLLGSHGLVMSLMELMDRQPELDGSNLMRAFRDARAQQPVKNCALIKLSATNTGWNIQRDNGGPFFNIIGN